MKQLTTLAFFLLTLCPLWAQTWPRYNAPICDRFRELQSTLSPLLKGEVEANGLCRRCYSDDRDMNFAVGSFATRNGTTLALNLFVATKTLILLDAVLMGLWPRTLGDGTLAGPYVRSSRGFSKFLTLEPDHACHLLVISGPDHTLSRLVREAHRQFTPTRVRCEVRNLEESYRVQMERERGVVQPSSTRVTLPRGQCP